MSNNAENEGGSIHGDNNASNKGGSIYGDNNASNEGGSIGDPHHHQAAQGVASFAETIGDGATTVFAVTDNLGTLDTMQEVYNPLTGATISPPAYTAVHTSPDVTTFTFAVAPAAGAA